MSDEWRLPVPKEDPEARPASLDGEGGSCPFPMPDVNVDEVEIEDESESGKAPGRDR